MNDSLLYNIGVVISKIYSLVVAMGLLPGMLKTVLLYYSILLSFKVKVMCMNDKRQSFKLLSNEWEKVKCKGHPRKSCFARWIP